MLRRGASSCKRSNWCVSAEVNRHHSATQAPSGSVRGRFWRFLRYGAVITAVDLVVGFALLGGERWLGVARWLGLS